jgi:2-methylisocitrate lyase-like PEP mutase family enzyme
MDAGAQAVRADAFRELHSRPEPLVLLNAWDVNSARMVAAAFPAVATSSGAVAATLGYEDGQQVPLDLVCLFVRRMVRAIEAPLSVDFEAGYGDSPAEAADSVRQLLEAGAIGINVEDGLVGGERRLAAPADHAAKVAAIREEAARYGVPLFINARIDTFWLNVGTPEENLEGAIARGAEYARAGADGLFVPGLVDLTLIGRLAPALPLPLNIMATPSCPPVAELAAMGVKRVSAGAWPMIVMRRQFAAIARASAADGSFAPLFALTED